MKQRILVELDAVLDTRLGVLMQMGVGEQALALNYRQRRSDRWNELGLTVDQAEFDRRYAARDIYTLAASRPTNITYLLNQITEYLSKLRLNAPMYETCEVILNTYPYDLDQGVLDEIVVAVGVWVSMECTVTTINLPTEAVTPKWLMENTEGYVLYDFNQWLVLHEDGLKTHRMPRNMVMAPKLYWNETPEEDTVEVDGMGMVNPFAAVELALLEYLGLNFQDPEFFSLIVI